MNNLFQENPLRNEMEFDFTQGRLWEKRDSQKLIKDNKAWLKLLQEEEEDVIFDINNSNAEDEFHGFNTKPCFSIDLQSIRDFQDELPSLSLLREDSLIAEREEAKEEMIQQEDVKSAVADEHVAVVLADPQTTIVNEWRQNELNLGDEEESLSSPAISMLEFAKKWVQNKKPENEAFEWNNFLVRRACFRGISVYYKSKFSKINTSWQRKRVNKKKKTPMNVLIKEFATQEFGSIIDRLTEEQWVSFRNTLYSILFSHRYKKNDDFLEGVDFSLIRGVLYSYTTETRVELMSNPFFSLVVLNFLQKGKVSFIRSKVKNKPQLYSEELKAELEALEEEAKGYTQNLISTSN